MPDMTHPKGVTAEDREAAFSLDNVMSGGFLKPHEQLAYINGECDDWHNVVAMRDHRLSSTAALEAEIAFLKARLESAEEALIKIRDFRGPPDHDTRVAMRNIARAFLQEQEKQNG